MAKRKTPTAPAVTPAPISFADFGFSFATAVDTAQGTYSALVQRVLPTLEGADPATLEASHPFWLGFVKGGIVRVNDALAATFPRVVKDGEDFRVLGLKDKHPDAVHWTPAAIMAVPAADFGKMPKPLKAILAPLKKKVQDRLSDYKRAFLSAYKRETDTGAERQARSANKSTAERVADALAGIVRKNKWGLAHQDDTSIGVTAMQTLVDTFVAGYKAERDKVAAIKH